MMIPRNPLSTLDDTQQMAQLWSNPGNTAQGGTKKKDGKMKVYPKKLLKTKDRTKPHGMRAPESRDVIDLKAT